MTRREGQGQGQRDRERDTEIGEGQMHKDAGTGIRKEV